jgi:hypothetical protein
MLLRAAAPRLCGARASELLLRLAINVLRAGREQALSRRIGLSAVYTVNRAIAVERPTMLTRNSARASQSRHSKLIG